MQHDRPTSQPAPSGVISIVSTEAEEDDEAMVSDAAQAKRRAWANACAAANEAVRGEAGCRSPGRHAACFYSASR